MRYEDYLDLIDAIAALIEDLGRHPDAAVGSTATELLQRLDLLHREALQRLIEGLRARGSAPVLDQLSAADPVVRLLLGLYDFAELPLDPGATAAPQGFVPREQLTLRRDVRGVTS